MKTFLICIASVMIFDSCGPSAGDKPKVQHDTLKTTNILEKNQKEIISDGEYIKHYPNGVVEMRGMMKAGKRDGIWKSFYDNGLPWSETTFMNGVKEGPTVTWYENNQKRYEGTYKNDSEYGTWTFYDEQGRIIKTENFK
jgi:antitoxin component YwqK of YwqJK toxin-antitoxin module